MPADLLLYKHYSSAVQLQARAKLVVEKPPSSRSSARGGWGASEFENGTRIKRTNAFQRKKVLLYVSIYGLQYSGSKKIPNSITIMNLLAMHSFLHSCTYILVQDRKLMFLQLYSCTSEACWAFEARPAAAQTRSGKAAQEQQSIAGRGRLAGREHGEPGTIRLDNLRTERAIPQESTYTRGGRDSIFVLLGKCVVLLDSKLSFFFLGHAGIYPW